MRYILNEFAKRRKEQECFSSSARKQYRTKICTDEAPHVRNWPRKTKHTYRYSVKCTKGETTLYELTFKGIDIVIIRTAVAIFRTTVAVVIIRIFFAVKVDVAHVSAHALHVCLEPVGVWLLVVRELIVLERSADELFDLRKQQSSIWRICE